MLVDAYEAFKRALASVAPKANPETVVTQLANDGYQISPRRKSKPKKPKRPKLKLIDGGKDTPNDR